MKDGAESLFWQIAGELHAEDRRIVEGTIMGGRCVRVGAEFLALVDFKGSGLVVKLPRARVDELVRSGVGVPFAPAGRVFSEWVSIPAPDAQRWRALLREGASFVGGDGDAAAKPARRSKRPRSLPRSRRRT